MRYVQKKTKKNGTKLSRFYLQKKDFSAEEILELQLENNTYKVSRM